MALSIQFHKYEGKAKHGHNSKISVRSKEGHIRGENEGGFIINLIDCDWKDKIDNDIFKNEIKEFNSKQTRKDRTKDSYYDECVERERKDDEKKIIKNDKDGSGVFRPVQEFIVGIYGKDMNQKDKIKLLEDYLKDFIEENKKNLIVVGAYIHVDEQTDLIKKGLKTAEDVDPHLHLDVVPVAHGYKKGMTKQISMTGALKELGFEKINRKHNEIVNFENHNRELIKQKLQSLGYNDFAAYKGEEHYEKEAYQKRQELKELDTEIANKNNEIKDLKKEKINRQRENIQIENEIENLKSENNFLYNENIKFDKKINKKNKELEEINNELLETQSAVNELEEKGDFLHNQLSEKKEEFELLKNEFQNLKFEIDNIVPQYQLNKEQSKDFVDSIHTIILNSVYAGRKIEKEKMEGVDRDEFINRTVQKQFKEIAPSLQLIQDNNNKLKQIINEKINAFKKIIEKKKEEKKIDKNLNQFHYEDHFKLFFDKDGKISEKSEQYLERQITNMMYENVDNKHWQNLQKIYLDLDSENRKEMVNYIKKDCIKYLRDYNSNEIQMKKEKFKNYVYSKSPNYCRFGQGLLQKLYQYNEMNLDGYER